jgi:hypothetical protein
MQNTAAWKVQHETNSFHKVIELQKKKGKKGQRLNLCCKETKGVEYYSPNKVVDAREYLKTNETAERAESESKEAKNIQTATTI